MNSASGWATIGQVLKYSLLVLIALFCLVPVVWMVTTAFKSATEVFRIPPIWLPSRITFGNFWEVLGSAQMRTYFLNTIFLSSASTIGALVLSLFAGYVFARFDFALKNLLFVVLILFMLLPLMITAVPLYVLYIRIGLYNTFLGLLLSYLAWNLPMAVWMFRGFLVTIPKELEEAAMIDGCGRIGAVMRVVLPLATPGVTSVGVYVFLVSWKQFTLPLVLANSKSIQPISVGLTLYRGEYDILWGNLMAAASLMALPPILFYVVFQRRLAKGLVEGGLQ